MFSDGAYQDPRSHLIFADAKEVVETCSDGSLDVLICDLNDPLEGGPCWKLYSQEFYLTAYRKLAPGGVLVTQAGCSSVWLHTEEDSQYSAICNTLKTVFGPDQVPCHVCHPCLPPLHPPSLPLLLSSSMDDGEHEH